MNDGNIQCYECAIIAIMSLSLNVTPAFVMALCIYI